MPHRYLILSASMGAGHHGVAAELARRLAARGDAAETVDLLALLPGRLGPALRVGYHGMLGHAPWLYQAIYRGFFALEPAGAAPAELSTDQPARPVSTARIRENGPRGGAPGGRGRPSTSPVVLAALPGLRRLLAAYRPDAVVSTFHLCGQAAGRLRQRGELAVPSVVVLTDFALNRVWLHPGTDLFLAPSADIAAEVSRRTGTLADAPGPVVSERFHAARRQRAGQPADRVGDAPVLVAGGAWGVGEAVEQVARALVRANRRAVVLCGRNEALRQRLAGRPGVRALGWTDTMPELMAGAAALVENAGGVTATEAFAAGLPVVTHRPIPGHGRDSAARLAAAGLVSRADDDASLLAALDALSRPGPHRDQRVAAAAALFRADPAERIARFVAERSAAPA